MVRSSGESWGWSRGARYDTTGRIEALSRRKGSVGSLRTATLPSDVPKETTSGRPEGKDPEPRRIRDGRSRETPSLATRTPPEDK